MYKKILLVLGFFVFLSPKVLFPFLDKCRSIFSQNYSNYHFYTSECSRNVFKLLELYESSEIPLDDLKVLLILYDKRKTLYGVSEQNLTPAFPRERWRSEKWLFHVVIEIPAEGSNKAVIFDMDFQIQKQFPIKEYFETMFGNNSKFNFEGNPLDRIYIRPVPAKIFFELANELKNPIEAIRNLKKRSSYLDPKYQVMSVREYIEKN